MRGAKGQGCSIWPSLTNVVDLTLDPRYDSANGACFKTKKNVHKSVPV